MQPKIKEREWDHTLIFSGPSSLLDCMMPTTSNLHPATPHPLKYPMIRDVQTFPKVIIGHYLYILSVTLEF
jgi:hypothetical protein